MDITTKRRRNRTNPISIADMAEGKAVDAGTVPAGATVEQIVEAAAVAVEQHLDGKLIDASTLTDEQVRAFL